MLSNWKSIGLVLLLGLIAWLATGCGEGSSSSQTTTVSGTITDDVGVPMQSATVTAVQRSSSTLAVAQTANQASTVTDSKGHYELTVPEGDVEIVASKDGFEATRQSLGQRGGPPGDANMALKDGKGPCARMDTDGDGLVSQTEWKGPPEDFLKIDTDSDGKLTQAELEAAKKTFQDKRPNFGTMDKNSDGKISKDEWLGPSGAFTEIDADGDGSLSETELQTAFEKRRPPNGAPPSGSPPPEPPSGS